MRWTLATTRIQSTAAIGTAPERPCTNQELGEFVINNISSLIYLVSMYVFLQLLRGSTRYEYLASIAYTFAIGQLERQISANLAISKYCPSDPYLGNSGCSNHPAAGLRHVICYSIHGP